MERPDFPRLSEALPIQDVNRKHSLYQQIRYCTEVDRGLLLHKEIVSLLIQ